MRHLLIVLVAVGAAELSSAAREPRVSEEPVVHRSAYWPNGQLKLSASYRHDVYQGEYRTWYESGRPYEFRHFDNGRESGLQQSWTEDGTLYLNYEVRNGRHYGLINAKPCL